MILKVLITVAVIILVLLVLHFIFPLIEVCGESMYPTYKDGEILLGTKIFLRSRIKKGDVIVYKSPTDGQKVIKRVFELKDNKELIYFLGDNQDHSYDSRYYGYVSKSNIICKVRSRPKEKLE